MLSIRQRLQIVLSVLLITSIMCNMPGGNQAQEEEAVVPPENIEVIKEETITENLDAFAANLTTHPETSELMDIIQSTGFTTYVEGGEFEFVIGDTRAGWQILRVLLTPILNSLA
jgi:hypothetical protein